MSWFWLALSAAILWGLGYTINQATLKYFSTIKLLFFESIIVFIVCLIYFIWQGNLSVFITKLASPKYLGLIICSSIIYILASMLILTSIGSSNASLAAIIESCYPVFTVIFAYVIFGESQLNIALVIGFILILTGIIIVKIYGQ